MSNLINGWAVDFAEARILAEFVRARLPHDGEGTLRDLVDLLETEGLDFHTEPEANILAVKALQLLAQPYADDPEYRRGWRP